MAKRPILGGLTTVSRYIAGLFRQPARALVPYHQPVAPFRHGLTKAAMIAFIILIGMIYGFLIAIFPLFLYLYLAVPIGVLILLVIWALPESDNPPIRAINWLFFAIFATISLWPNYLAIAISPLPWITLMRLWTIPLTLLFVISLSISPRFRAEASEWFATDRWILSFLLVFIFLGAVTLPMTSTPFGAFNRFVIDQFEWTAVFFTACYIFRKEHNVMLWAKLFCGFAIFLAVTSVVEFRLGYVPWANHIPSFLKIQSLLVQAILTGGTRAATGSYRIQSIFATSLNFAEFLALATPFTIHFLVTAKRQIVRLLLLLYLPFLFWVILTTDSRLGMVGFFASILLYGLFWSVKHWLQDRHSLIAASIVFAYPTIIAAFLALSVVWRRLEVMIWGGGPQQASNEARQVQWGSAMRGFKEWPFGYGTGEAAQVVGWTNEAGELSLDSYYLTILLDYGLIGFVAFYGMFAIAGGKAIRAGIATRDEEIELLLPLGIMLGVFIIIKGVLSQEDNHTIMFFALGAVVALYNRFAAQQRS